MKPWTKAALYSAGTLAAMYFAGSYGFGAGAHMQHKRDIAEVKAWVETTVAPIVRIVKISHEPIAIIQAGICIPIGPSYPLPKVFRIQFVSPNSQPCGPGKAGEPLVDNGAMQSIKKGVQS